MIYSISGNLVVSQPVDAYFIVAVECNGIAYEIKNYLYNGFPVPKNRGIGCFIYLSSCQGRRTGTVWIL